MIILSNYSASMSEAKHIHISFPTNQLPPSHFFPLSVPPCLSHLSQILWYLLYLRHRGVDCEKIYFLLELEILQPSFVSKINVNISKIGPCCKVGENEGAGTIEGCWPFVYSQFCSGVQGIRVILRIEVSCLASLVALFHRGKPETELHFCCCVGARLEGEGGDALSRHRMMAVSMVSLTAEVWPRKNIGHMYTED